MLADGECPFPPTPEPSHSEPFVADIDIVQMEGRAIGNSGPIFQPAGAEAELFVTDSVPSRMPVLPRSYSIRRA